MGKVKRSLSRTKEMRDFVLYRALSAGRRDGDHMADCRKPHRFDTVEFLEDVEARSPAPFRSVQVKRGTVGRIVVERRGGETFKVGIFGKAGVPKCFADVRASQIQLVAQTGRELTGSSA